MSDQAGYLLSNTPEARQQIKHIKQLLGSEEQENIELAYALLGGGGVPDGLNFIAELKRNKDRMLLCARYGLDRVLDTIQELTLYNPDKQRLEDWKEALPKMKCLRKLVILTDDWVDFFTAFREGDSNIKILKLQGALTRNIPWSFATLSSLQVLVITHNTDLPNGRVIGELANLQFLLVANLDHFPEALLQLRQLKRFYCWDFSGKSLPENIHHLANLHTFSLKADHIKNFIS